MVDTGPEAELAKIERRIKWSRNADDLRRLLNQLNRFQDEIRPGGSEFVRARYFLLRGALYAKAARKNQAGWLGPSVDCLQYALKQFALAIESTRHHTDNEDLRRKLRELERICTYEAHATASVLRLWGEEPALKFGTDCLSDAQRRKEEKSRKHKFSLSSQF